MKLQQAKERLRERLPLSTKLWLKRMAVGSVASVIRLAARLYKLADRILLSATTHGLDLRRAWDVPAAPRAPFAQPFGAQDFLFLMNALSGAARPSLSSTREIRASIIIPVHNKAEFTFQCLRSLLREIDFDDTEVIVVNNASTDETRQVLSFLGDYVRVIENETNLGFVDACNVGAAAARGAHLVFLNNDTAVLPGWLDHLLETIEGDDSIGAVGSLFLYPDWRIQEAGAIIWRDGAAFHYGWGKALDDRRFTFAREVDYCSGASLLIRRDLFERLGGFDRRYAPAYYEDADLCFGVRSLGYRVVYQPASRLIHYEGATAGTDTRTGFKHFQIVNHEKFFDKWRETLEREGYPNDPARAELAANRKRGPYVFIFDDRIPTPDRDAGSARMLFILKSLAEWCKPVFVPISKTKWPEYEKILWKAGVETVSPLDWPRLLKTREFHAAILSRPFVAEALLPALRRADPNIKIVFDMVDAHFIRFGREHELTGDTATAREAARYRTLETRLARASDLIWCNSSEDKRAMEGATPGLPIAVIPTIHHLQAPGQSFDERKSLLFLGNLRHRPNTDAVHFYMKEAHPLVRAEIPEAELFIVGDNVTPDIAAYDRDGVRVLGYVPDIAPLLQSCRVMVAPIRFGAGVKGKIGEALAYGLPVVTTSIGAEGMGFTDGDEALIADDARAFAEAVIRVYRDRALWQRLADKGRAHIEQGFTPRVVGKIIKDSVKGVGDLDSVG